jgi:hypothetical protein
MAPHNVPLSVGEVLETRYNWPVALRSMTSCDTWLPDVGLQLGCTIDRLMAPDGAGSG